MIFIEKKKKATNGCGSSRKPDTEPKEEAADEGALENRDRLSTNGCETRENSEKPEKKKKKTKTTEEDPAFAAALRILTAGANSTYMLRRKLIDRGFSEEDADRAVKKAVEASLISDKRLMEGFIHSVAKRKLIGYYRLKQEVLRKFGREATEEYFASLTEDMDFLPLAVAYAKKHRQLEKKVLFHKLRQQGFTVSEIRQALAALSEEADPWEE